MKRLIAVTAAIFTCLVASASALPAPTYTAANLGNRTARLTSSPCLFGFCSYGWRYYPPSGNRLGVTMGAAQTITYQFPATGTQTFVLTVGGLFSATSKSGCPTSVTGSVTVT